MKAIKCELCGSNDLVKKDEYFICSYCHTKYSVEEAKKLMVEIEGTVKIDTTSKQNNHEKLAERAFNDKLYDQAYDYYNKLLELDCDNWVYVYKKGLCAAWQSTLANFRIDETIKACKNAFNIIEVENIELENKQNVCLEMALAISKVTLEFSILSIQHYNQFWKLESSAPDYWNQLEKCMSCQEYAKDLIYEYRHTLPECEDLYIDILKSLVKYTVEICKRRKYQTGHNQYGEVFGYIWYKNELRQSLIEKYDQYVKELKYMDHSYIAPILERSSQGGCYVATAVYGSYDCDEVWTLRRFRDEYLSKKIAGKIFIKLYYTISPTIVKWFGKTKWFNKINKKILDKWVINLRAKGY